MKKTLKIVFFLVVAVVLGYYAFATYQHAASLKGVVHKDADAIVKIGLQDIKETLVLDALTAPNYYVKNSKASVGSKDDDDKEAKDKGVIATPHNLVLFSLPDVTNTWFTTLTITNKEAFERYLQEEFKEKISVVQNDKTYETAKHSSGKLLLGWNSEKLVLAFGLTVADEKVATVFEELLVGQKFISSTDNSLLKLVKDTEGHLVYADTTGATAMYFEDGRAVIAGTHATNTSLPVEALTPSYSDASFALHYYQEFESKKDKQVWAKRMTSTSFFAKNKLNIDSILKPLNGAFSIAINGSTQQTDTVITYGYDDNFEKVAQKTVQQNEVPQINIRLQTKSQGLMRYLDSTNALSAQQIFTPFPLYQFQVQEHADHITMSTKHQNAEVGTHRSSYFFQVRTNFEKLQKDLAIPQTEAVFSLLNNMNIHAWQPEKNQVQLEGTVNGKNTDVNILSQLFFGLQDKNTNLPEAEL